MLARSSFLFSGLAVLFGSVFGLVIPDRAGATPATRFGVRMEQDWIPMPDGIRLSRSEEHTSELQSQSNIVCRLLLEKKKNKTNHQELTQIHSEKVDESFPLLVVML